MAARNSLRLREPLLSSGLEVVLENGRRGPAAKRRALLSGFVISVIALGLVLTFATSEHSSPSFLSSALSGWFTENSEDQLDERLQIVATKALGSRSGTIIIMDPQTGRIRAVVNSKLAFEESFRPGSTLKPLTALAALGSGVIDEGSESLCRERFSHEEFHTTCSHPRDLPPLNPTEAIAYSCNYYFGKVGERVSESSINSTLNDFGFGRQTGIKLNAEASGKLLRAAWRPESAMGEGDYLQTTPIQLLNAYATLVNGGHRFTPRRARSAGFVPSFKTDIEINSEHRRLILKGMRGVVRYGTAESAHLYSLPIQTFGKTGTATELNGFRMQGWFVGFASALPEDPNAQMQGAELAPDKVKLAVLVFLSRGHGAEAAELARPIFAEYARSGEAEGLGDRETRGVGDRDFAGSPRHSVTASRSRDAASVVRVHLVSENITRAMSLEVYVRGVVAAEGSTETEDEALKALAIASRTYALKNIHRHARDGYDFCTTTHCQRFRSSESGSTNELSSAVVAAVEKTKGEVLLGNDARVADSYFSASCGGATANLATLWGGNSPPHLRGVRDDYCASEPHANWTDTISQSQLLKALNSDARTSVGDRLEGVRIRRTDASGRAELIAIAGGRQLTVKGWDFKIIVGRALGWNLLKSSRFTVERAGSNFIFRGNGFGHGLGLCQEGAHVMAQRGANYRQILARYFPGTDVGALAAAEPREPRASADLLWNNGGRFESGFMTSVPHPTRAAPRRTLSSEDFRINYPATIN